MTQPTSRPQPGGRPLRIDIVVHGRFHAFALARALLALGHDVLLHTNYPGFVVERFGVPASRTRSFLVHGLASRAARWIAGAPGDATDRFLHTAFGQWAARGVRRDADLVYGFSGVMEEALALPRSKPFQLRAVVRGSAHICEQARLLEEEEGRVGVALERPGRWIIAREEREYALADGIFVLSSYARDTFLARGVPRHCIWTTPIGVDARPCRATAEAREARMRRLLSGDRLRVLTVGTFSFQKGAFDLALVASGLSHKMEFRFVGAQAREARALLARARTDIQIFDRVPERELEQHYAWADVFLYPTVQDGFAAVLLEALASGLPLIASTNCAAPDLLADGKAGWVVPVRDAAGMVERLLWCDANRAALVDKARAAEQTAHRSSWDAAARQMLSSCRGAISM